MEADDDEIDQRDTATKFVELLTAHQRDLYAYINTWLLGNAAASDVLQDTNLDLWARLENFDFRRPFLPWAFGFAFQRVMAFRKSQARCRLVFSDEVVSLISDAYIGDSADADSRLSALRTCVDKLEPRQRQVILDRYVSKASVKTIAARMGSTANQISARLYRIRRTLAKCVEATMVAEAGA